MANHTRREFLIATAKGMALATIPMVFKFDPEAAFASPVTGQDTMSQYLAHFGVDQSLIDKTIAIALERGGDYCDLFFQHDINSSINLEDNTVNSAFTGVDFGVGIRVLKGDQTGYSFTEEISPKAMAEAARTAANIASDRGGTAPAALIYAATPDFYPIVTRWEDLSIGRKVPVLLQINQMVAAVDKRIVKTQVSFSDDSSYVMIATSEGRVVCDYRPMTRLFVTATAEQNGRRERADYRLGGRVGIEYYDEARLQRAAGIAVHRAIELFDAVKPDAGEQPVVLAPGNSGILLHEAIGHGMEADFNRKGISIFSDKIGKPVAESFVNIVDDGTVPHMRGSINVDDEGNDTQKTFLVRDGILESYLHDHISARHYGVKPTGNGRRQDFRYQPMPRMRNTYMLAGPHQPDEIIASVKKGIYADTFANGEVHIGAGDFTFYVSSGYVIEDGKLGRPIKDVNIIGNGPDVLKKVVMVGNDMEIMEGGGTCGKDDQWAPVSFGLPTVKVSAITVGGVNA